MKHIKFFFVTRQTDIENEWLEYIHSKTEFKLWVSFLSLQNVFSTRMATKMLKQSRNTAINIMHLKAFDTDVLMHRLVNVF